MRKGYKSMTYVPISRNNKKNSKINLKQEVRNTKDKRRNKCS